MVSDRHETRLSSKDGEAGSDVAGDRMIMDALVREVRQSYAQILHLRKSGAQILLEAVSEPSSYCPTYV